jgi:cell division protein FtsW
MAKKRQKTTQTRAKRPSRRDSPAAQYDLVLLGIVAVLTGLGLVMIFSASYVQANDIYGRSTYYFLRQLQWLGIGAIVLVVSATVDYRILKRFSVVLMAGTMLVLLAVLVMGNPSLGAKRHLIGTSVQPSEIAKLTITIYIAYWLTSKGDRLKNVSYGLLPFAVLLGLVALLIVLQPDFGTTALVVFTALIMFFVAGADTKQLIVSLVVATITLLVAVTQVEYAAKRVEEFVTFLDDPLAGSYQVGAGLRAFASGGLFGEGLGENRGTVPLPFTDSIFAVVGEELGLVGTLGVVALFMALAYRGLRIALRSDDHFGLVLGCGITGWLSIQAFVNMAVNTATLPFSGLTLPFISYGGSSLVACMAGVGVLLSISRYGILPSSAARPASPDRRQARGEVHATRIVGWRNWWSRLSNSGRSRRTAKPRRRGNYTKRSPGYTVKASSTQRAAGLSRRVTRARRTIARRTGASRRSKNRSSNRRRIPRRA